MTQVWGNVAEWVGSVGTVGTFVFGFVILLREISQRKREDAEAFVVHASKKEGHLDLIGSIESKLSAAFTISAHNAGNKPVVYSTLRLGGRGEKELKIYRPLSGNKDQVMVPGDYVIHEMPNVPYSDEYEAYAEFIDGKNQLWVRDLIKHRFLSARKVRKLRKRSTGPLVPLGEPVAAEPPNSMRSRASWFARLRRCGK